jgi:hypothetical protein
VNCAPEKELVPKCRVYVPQAVNDLEVMYSWGVIGALPEIDAHRDSPFCDLLSEPYQEAHPLTSDRKPHNDQHG